jgi:hypothetical protein
MEFGEGVEGGTFFCRGRRLAQGLGIAQRRREKVGVDAISPSNARRPIASVTWEPTSPPCATYRV